MILVHAAVERSIKNAVVQAPDMPRIFFKVAYDGTDFSGWQVQPGRLTVQGEIERVLAQLFVNQPIRIHSSGRTDAGVHAMGQSVTCDLPDAPVIPPVNIKKALNHSLPCSIRILECRFVDDDFHARFSAVGKSYSYIINRNLETPFTARYSWHQPLLRDLSSMTEACGVLTGTHDFAAFTTSRKDMDDTIRTIYKIDVEESGDFLSISFTGSGFLYKMVRNLTGLLVLIGQGLYSKDSVESILLSKTRSAAPKGAPPHGLFLMDVYYGKAELEDFKFDLLPFPHWLTRIG